MNPVDHGARRGRTRRKVRIAIGLAISAACVTALFFLIDWRRTGAALAHVDLGCLVITLALLLFCYTAFAVRWWVLVGRDPSLPLPRLFAVLMMGLAVNVTFPLRPGDGLRAYVVGYVYGYGTLRAIGSIVVERLLDVATVLALGGIVAVKVKLPASTESALAWTALITVTAVAAVLIFSLFSKPLNVFLAQLTSTSRHNWIRTIVVQANELANGLNISWDHWRLPYAALWSAVGWAFFSGAMIVCLVAFGIPSPIIGGILLTVLTNLGGIIPSSPGSIGIYHVLGVLALSTTGVSQELALAATVVSHALIVGVQLVMGGLAFVTTDGVVRELMKQWRKPAGTD
jgi:uncharacterized protein (TIRG00374 family)